MKATLRLTAAAGLVLALGALTACAPTVALTPSDDATNPECAAVITRLPETAAELEIRETNAQGTAAWGSPETSVILHCGVDVPDPTASLACFTYKGIDWLRDPADDPRFAFITYGRDPAIRVIVDSEDGVSGNAVLDDIATAVSIIPAERNCISPLDVPSLP